MIEVGYENLHVHSDFSLLDGFAQVEEYAERALKNNQKYLCVTDHGMMAVVPRQFRAAEAAGLTPLFGCEMYLQDKHRSKEDMADMSDEEKKEMRKSYHLLAIAYNNEGYSNLVSMTSWAWLNGFYYKPRVNYEQLQKHKAGIIFTSCCYNGEIGQAFERGGPEAAEAMLVRHLGMFGENFYLELMLLDFNKQKPYDEWLIKMHDKYHVPLIISTDCLVEGTTVITNKGTKFIEDIEVGDKVLTHLNEFKSVQVVNARQLNEKEKVFRVKTARGTFAWEATGNHLVRVAKVGKIKWDIQKMEIKSFEWKRIDQLTPKDYLIVPKIDRNFVFADHAMEQLDLLDYVDKKLYVISTNDKITNCGNFSIKLLYNEQNSVFISHRGFNHVNIPRFLPITNDLLKIIGLYIAEGSVTNSLISFGVHSREVKEIRLIKRYFKQFGIKVGVAKRGNGVAVRFSSVVFANLFANLCGKGAKNKCLPKINGRFFGQFIESQVKDIVGQYWKGDGSVSNKYSDTIVSTSKRLIYDLALVFNSVGLFVVPYTSSHKHAKHINPNANSQNWNDTYRISFGSNSKIKFENYLFNTKQEYKHTHTKRGKRQIDGSGCYAIKIRKVEKIEYTKKVYNLQVADHESYTANLFQVHNCHYCNPEDSKYQRYMLMVQTGKTKQEVAQTVDASMEDKSINPFEMQDTNLWYKSEKEIDEKWLQPIINPTSETDVSYSKIIPYELLLQAKQNTVKICEKAKNVTIDRSVKLPNLPDADEKLKIAIARGVAWRGLKGKTKYLTRLKEEYELICKKGFASYFLIQQQIINEAKRICPKILGWGKGDEAVGPGRGSAAASVVCYVLGITDIDPIKHDLLFSRFLNESRGGRNMKIRFTKMAA